MTHPKLKIRHVSDSLNLVKWSDIFRNMCILAVTMKMAKAQQTHVHDLRLIRQIP